MKPATNCHLETGNSMTLIKSDLIERNKKDIKILPCNRFIIITGIKEEVGNCIFLIYNLLSKNVY